MTNLLPPEEKKILMKIQQRKLLTVLGIELLAFLVSLLLVFLIVMFYIMGMNIGQKSVLNDVEMGIKSSDFSQFRAIMLQYNKDLFSVDFFYKTQKPASKALDTLFAVQRPAGLYFSSVASAPEQKPGRMKFNIFGTSDTRDSLTSFKSNLEKEKLIENIEFSPSSWISQKNINFNVTLDIKFSD